jgi:hypothetical protein
MAPVLLFVHGRSQASNDEIAKDPDQLASYVLGKKRSWLGGLAKGLITAGHRPADESAVLFPFYGNVFADAIREYEDGGGRRPDLETLAGGPDGDDPLAATKADALLDAAAAVPRRSHGWLNAYDVLDFVALLHPLAGDFAATVAGQVADERTYNPTGPHSITDYPADPDVAGPIGRALEF